MKRQIEALRTTYQQRLGMKQQLESQISAHYQELQSLKESILLDTQTLELLTLTSKEARTLAKKHLETIVTQALQYIMEDDYRFVIELSESGSKPSCEFYVEREVEGEISRQNPKTACGGGIVDMISSTLRYAYVEIFNDPKIQNRLIVLDEPGKMISQQAAQRFAMFIRSLSQEFDKQTLMITHKEVFAEQSDQTIWVTKPQDKSVIRIERNEENHE